MKAARVGRGVVGADVAAENGEEGLIRTGPSAVAATATPGEVKVEVKHAWKPHSVVAAPEDGDLVTKR